ncbi:hypothetical protein HDU97_000417 [Phlyctochytrium planicorne]|nr:hypothetical protein HDU97_000417 [Phlyctochytrium planicorne]
MEDIPQSSCNTTVTTTTTHHIQHLQTDLSTLQTQTTALKSHLTSQSQHLDCLSKMHSNLLIQRNSLLDSIQSSKNLYAAIEQEVVRLQSCERGESYGDGSVRPSRVFKDADGESVVRELGRAVEGFDEEILELVRKKRMLMEELVALKLEGIEKMVEIRKMLGTVKGGVEGNGASPSQLGDKTKLKPIRIPIFPRSQSNNASNSATSATKMTIKIKPKPKGRPRKKQQAVVAEKAVVEKTSEMEVAEASVIQANDVARACEEAGASSPRYNTRRNARRFLQQPGDVEVPSKFRW